MEGKGWFVIYGILALVVGFLVITNVQLAGRVADLEKSQTTSQPSDSPQPDATETPEAEPTPDLSTPDKRDAARKADLAEIQQALDKYKTDKGQYPNSLNELVPDFLESVPTDPLAPRYTFRYQKVGAGFRLTAFMENKNDADDPKDGKKDQIYTVTQATP